MAEPAAAAAGNVNRLVCESCLDDPATVCFLPCRHVCVCKPCYVNMKKKTSTCLVSNAAGLSKRSSEQQHSRQTRAASVSFTPVASPNGAGLQQHQPLPQQLLPSKLRASLRELPQLFFCSALAFQSH